MATRSHLIQNKPAVVYDGDCAFCSWYVEHLSVATDVKKIDARKDQAIVEQLDQANIDIDRDMALLDKGQMFQGADALNRIATNRCKKGGWFNTLHILLFRWRPIALVVYSVLRVLRIIYLRISGRSSIHSNV